MNRRHLLTGAAALAFTRIGLAEAKGGPVLRRRTRPGDKRWPSSEHWDRLQQEVNGNLIKPLPLLAACVPDSAQIACTDTLKLLRNPYFLGDQPSGTQVSGWLDAWTPAVSSYAVVAQSAADVAAAVRFAHIHDLRIAVKGGGHSYQGTSNAPDSLLIWTRHMRDIELHTAFRPSGCPAGELPVPAVSVDAGAMWMDVYDAVTTKAGLYVQGGGCATVGVAGLIQSGGFGSFSKAFGLASAHLLEAEIVTADGNIRTVNAWRDPDLFWALQGGGGGAYGVVTRVTLRTHELPDRFGSVSLTAKAATDETFEKLIDQFLGFYRTALMNPSWGESVTFKPDNTLAVSMVCQGLSDDEIADCWKPFFDFVANSPDLYVLTDKPSSGTRSARTWWDTAERLAEGSTALVRDDRPGAAPVHAWWSGDQEQVSAYLHAYDSIWLSADLLEDAKKPELANRLFTATRSAPVSLHFNKGLAGAPADCLVAARKTATNADVADAFALVIVAAGGAPPIPELKRSIDIDAAHANATRVKDAMASLRQAAPKAGSYVSESNYFNENWKTDFWGENYAKLLQVKKRYDPDGLFIVHHGVGCEAWSNDGFTRLYS